MPSPALEALRSHDRPLFLACLLLPETRREAVAALFAWREEIRRIPRLVSEPILGHIRLSWWREAVEALYTGAARRPDRDHPYLDPLNAAIQAFSLPQDAFLAILNAHATDLEPAPFANMSTWEAYSDGCDGTFWTLITDILHHEKAPSPTSERPPDTALTALARADTAWRTLHMRLPGAPNQSPPFPAGWPPNRADNVPVVQQWVAEILNPALCASSVPSLQRTAIYRAHHHKLRKEGDYSSSHETEKFSRIARHSYADMVIYFHLLLTFLRRRKA